MGEIHYMISEAAKVVGVEPHVLRYWEEELDLTIGRTEMGHRYYTEEDMQLFLCIRRLKDEGVLLKELKELIPDIQRAKESKRAIVTEENTANEVKEQDGLETVLERELKKNNIILEGTICNMVTDSLKKEMSYLLDAKDQLEEDRYRRLDTLIRQQQIQAKENARKTVPILMKHALGLG